MTTNNIIRKTVIIAVLIVSAIMSGCITSTDDVTTEKPEISGKTNIINVISDVIPKREVIHIDEYINDNHITGEIIYINDKFVELTYKCDQHFINDVAITHSNIVITQKYGEIPIYDMHGYFDCILGSLNYTATGPMDNSKTTITNRDGPHTEYVNILPTNFNKYEPVSWEDVFLGESSLHGM